MLKVTLLMQREQVECWPKTRGMLCTILSTVRLRMYELRPAQCVPHCYRSNHLSNCVKRIPQFRVRALSVACMDIGLDNVPTNRINRTHRWAQCQREIQDLGDQTAHRLALRPSGV